MQQIEFRTLPAFFHAACRQFPNDPALDIPAGSHHPFRVVLSYQHLAARVAHIRGHFTRPFTRDEVVLINAPRFVPELLAAQIAVMDAGAAFTVLDDRFTDEQCDYMLQDAKIRLILDHSGARRRNYSATSDVEVVHLDRLANVPAFDFPSEARPEGLAYVIYTSGTEGKPKGVMIEQQSISHLIHSESDEFQLSAGVRVAQGSSAAYDSSLEETWMALAVGGTVVILDDETSRLGPDLLPWLREQRIEVFCPPPTLLRAMGCEDPSRELPSLRVLYVGGEPLPQDVVHAWAPGRRLVNGYGPTECTVTVTRGDVVPGDDITIGKPVRGHTIRLVLEDGTLAAPGEPGELWISGPGVARGYLGRPDLTAKKFVEIPGVGRFYRTGDLVRQESDGRLYYLGRVDAQVKLRGFRVELEAIEAALLHHPEIAEAAATVRSLSTREVLFACVVLKSPGHTLDVAEAKREVQNRLPDYMVPAWITVLESMPRSTGGKLQRHLLPDPPLLAGFSPFSTAASLDPRLRPRDQLEEQIAIAAAHGLKLPEPVSIDADFFTDLGGDSLAAAMFVSAMRRLDGAQNMAVRDIYDLRSVRRIRDHLGAGKVNESTPRQRRPIKRGSPWKATLIETAVKLFTLICTCGLSWWLYYEFLPESLSSLPTGVVFVFVLLAVLIGLPLYGLAAVEWVRFLKQTLIGQYTPGAFPVWGSFALRHRVVAGAARLIPWQTLVGTEAASYVLRRLGARIGRRVHIHRGVNLLQGGWDLLNFGDDVVLAQDAAIRPVSLHDGHFVFAPVNLSNGVHVDVRAAISPDVDIGSNTHITAMSHVESGTRCETEHQLHGVPARAETALPDPTTNVIKGEHSQWSPLVYALWMITTRIVFGTLVHSTALITTGFLFCLVTSASPGEILLLTIDASAASSLYGFWSAFAVVDLVFLLVLRAFLSRLLPRIRPGCVPRFSLPVVVADLKVTNLDAAGHWISGTLFWPIWLRAAGMAIGAKSEISTIIDVVPELVSIGKECFFADGIYLGGARINGDQVCFAETHIGAGAFLGNHAYIPAGTRLAEGVLIGVCTVAPAETRQETSWFGHPPLSLPRKAETDADRSLTHSPGPLRFMTRVFWEVLRFAVPIPPVLLLIIVVSQLLEDAERLSTVEVALIRLPLYLLAAQATLVAIVLVTKWLLLGRVSAGRHPLWSCWCSRWDFHYVLWANYALAPLSRLEGTEWLKWFLRAIGCRIGRNVALGSGFAQVVDPDMLTIEDNATVSGLFQAHTFEDRVLKIAPLHIRRGADVGSGSVLFYGSDIGPDAEVRDHAVVMKNEVISEGQVFAGIPSRPAVPSRPPATEPRPCDVAPGPPRRSEAADVARGLAVCGMIYVHLVPETGTGRVLDDLAAALADHLEGKSAALFFLLFGVTLRLTFNPSDPQTFFRRNLRRGLIFYALGTLIYFCGWTSEVLRALAGISLFFALAGRFLRHVPILSLAGCLSASVALFFAGFPYFAADWAAEDSHAGELSFDAAHLRFVLINGYYPLVSWMTFVLLGFHLPAWTESLKNTRRWLGPSFAVSVVTWIFWRFAGETSADNSLTAAWKFSWFPTTVPFLVLCGAPAACVWITLRHIEQEGWPRSPLWRHVAALGRSSLTHYVGHLVFAFATLRFFRGDDEWSASVGLAAAIVYVAAAVLFNHYWFQRCDRGPLERLVQASSTHRQF